MNAPVTQLRSIRCSSLPLANLCPGSQQPPKLRIREKNEAADVGTAAHKCFEDLVRYGSVNWEAVGDVAKSYGVDEDDLRVLCALGTRVWRQVSDLFPNAMAELSMSAELAPGVFLTGTGDGLSIPILDGTVARGFDWKTGYLDSNYREQALGYCALTLLNNPHLQECHITVLWVRDEAIETHSLTRFQLDEWIEKTVALITKWDGVSFQTGKHCGRCPRNHECEAGITQLRRDLAVVTDRSLVARVESELALMAPEEIISVLEKADTVVTFAKRIRDAVKQHVQNFGDIQDGKHVLTIEHSARRSVDTLAAWPVLEQAGFEDEDFSQAVEVRISKAEKVLAKKAGRGNGAAAIRQLQADLKAAGAIQSKVTDRLVVRRV